MKRSTKEEHVSVRRSMGRSGGLIAVLVGVLYASTSQAGQKEAIDLNCLIEPKSSIVVAAPAIGVVGVVSVQRGDFVVKGQVLAELESSVEWRAVELARARAENVAELDGSEARLSFERRRLERTRKLHNEGVLSSEKLDEIESAVLIAETNSTQAKENAQLAQLDLSRSRTALSVRTIRSPVDGVIVEVILHEGEYADPPQILEVAQIDPLNVEVYVPAGLLGKISVGDKGSVVVEEPVTRTYEATVVVVDRVVDAASGTFGVRLELQNPERDVLAGLSCRVQF